MHLGSYNRVAKCGDSETLWFYSNSYEWCFCDDIKHMKFFKNHHKSKNWCSELRLVLDCRYFSIVFILREKLDPWSRCWQVKEIIGMKNHKKIPSFPYLFQYLLHKRWCITDYGPTGLTNAWHKYLSTYNRDAMCGDSKTASLKDNSWSMWNLWNSCD